MSNANHYLRIAAGGAAEGNLWQPQAKFDHEFQVTGLVNSQLLTLAMVGGFRPKESIEELEIPWGFRSLHVAQKITIETGDIRIYDYVDPNSLEALEEWYDKVRDPNTGVPRLAFDYMREAKVIAYWPDHSCYREWTLIDTYPTSLDVGDWDYGESAVAEISATIRYRFAVRHRKQS